MRMALRVDHVETQSHLQARDNIDAYCVSGKADAFHPLHRVILRRARVRPTSRP